MLRFALIGLISMAAMAQEENHLVIAQRIAGSADAGPVLKSDFAFVSAEMSFEGKTVTGSPYSANAVTETVQTLADGNRISQKSEGLVARDSQGRTRREQTLGAGLMPAGDTQKIVFINDPVAQANYVLRPDRTAEKMAPMKPPAPGEIGQHFMITNVGGGTGPLPPPMAFSKTARLASKDNVEELGQQTIEGVLAEGKRITAVIPAGSIGNDRDIQVVNETWYSPELQTIVSSTRTDPRMGTTTFRLTNIQRAEPSADLFQVPSDYTVHEMPKPNVQYDLKTTTK